jgi:hypothetical protein
MKSLRRVVTGDEMVPVVANSALPFVEAVHDNASMGTHAMRRTAFIRNLVAVIAAIVAFPARGFEAPMSGGNPTKGTWKFGSYGADGFLFDLKFHFADGSFDHNQFAVRPTEIGLPSDGRSPLDRAATFILERDAGSFACTGTFAKGAGSGTASFRTNTGFVRFLISRGFAAPASRDVLDLALFDVSRGFVVSSQASLSSLTARELVHYRVIEDRSSSSP